MNRDWKLEAIRDASRSWKLNAAVNGAIALIGVGALVAAAAGSGSVAARIVMVIFALGVIGYAAQDLYRKHRWRRIPHFKDPKYDHVHVVMFGNGKAITLEDARQETERHLREGNPSQDDPCKRDWARRQRLRAITGGLTFWHESPLYAPGRKNEDGSPYQANGYTSIGSQKYHVVVFGYLSKREQEAGEPRELYEPSVTAWGHEIDHEAFGSVRGHAHESQEERDRIAAFQAECTEMEE